MGRLHLIDLGIVAAVLPLLFPQRGAQMTTINDSAWIGVDDPIGLLPNWIQPAVAIAPATYGLQWDCGSMALARSYLLPLANSGIMLILIGLFS